MILLVLWPSNWRIALPRKWAMHNLLMASQFQVVLFYWSPLQKLLLSLSRRWSVPLHRLPPLLCLQCAKHRMESVHLQLILVQAALGHPFRTWRDDQFHRRMPNDSCQHWLTWYWSYSISQSWHCVGHMSHDYCLYRIDQSRYCPMQRYHRVESTLMYGSSRTQLLEAWSWGGSQQARANASLLHTACWFQVNRLSCCPLCSIDLKLTNETNLTYEMFQFELLTRYEGCMLFTTGNLKYRYIVWTEPWQVV